MYSSLAPWYEQIFSMGESKKLFFQNLFGEYTGNFLDLGCATGELIRWVYWKGWKVYGVDSESALLEKASCLAPEKSESFQLILGKMEELPFHLKKESFQIVSCMGNTLAYLQSMNALQDVLQKSKDLLVENGIFVVQVVNFPKILQTNSGQFAPLIRQDLTFFREYQPHESGMIRFSTRLEQNHKQIHQGQSLLFPWEKDHLSIALHNVGYRNIEFYGNFDCSAFCEKSSALIVVARK